MSCHQLTNICTVSNPIKSPFVLCPSLLPHLCSLCSKPSPRSDQSAPSANGPLFLLCFLCLHPNGASSWLALASAPPDLPPETGSALLTMTLAISVLPLAANPLSLLCLHFPCVVVPRLGPGSFLCGHHLLASVLRLHPCACCRPGNAFLEAGRWQQIPNSVLPSEAHTPKCPLTNAWGLWPPPAMGSLVCAPEVTSLASSAPQASQRLLPPPPTHQLPHTPSHQLSSPLLCRQDAECSLPQGNDKYAPCKPKPRQSRHRAWVQGGTFRGIGHWHHLC